MPLRSCVLTLLPLVVTLLAIERIVAQAPQPSASVLADDDVAGWARALLDNQNAAIERLSQRGADGVPLLRTLLGDPRENVRRGAARSCERIGPAAAPLLPELLSDLRGSGEWWTQLYAAQALTAIGNADPAVIEALLDITCTTEVPHLRAVCATGLDTLTPDAAILLIAAADEDRFRDLDHALQAMKRLGDAAEKRLIEQLVDRRGTPSARALTERTLACRGWRLISQLDRAGLGELVQRTLRVGALQGIAFAEHFELHHEAAIPSVVQLPRVRWELGAHRGIPLTLLRAEEQPHGFVVSRLTLRHGPERQPSITLDRTTIARAHAANAVRQLDLIALAEIRKVSNIEVHGWSSAEFYARVHIERDGEQLLDAAFDGHPTFANVPDRLRVEAARNVMTQLLHGVTWTTRVADDRDREQLRTAISRTENPHDLAARLREIQALLDAK